jgi:hypothetical protein
MSLEQQQIKDEFVSFSEQFGPAVIMPAVVTAINEDDTIAVQFTNGSILDDVRMKAVIKDGSKFLLIPKINSNVLVGKIQNSDEYVLLTVHEIDNVEFIIGGKFLFKNDADNLLQLMQDFIQAALEERHMTNVGPTINLTPDSIARYTALQTRFNNFLSTT